MIAPAANLLPRDGEVRYHPSWFASDEAETLLADLVVSPDWDQQVATIFGQRIPLPRLTAWYGPSDYAYSGVIHRAAPFPPVVSRIAEAVRPLAPGVDSVLCNFYRDGRDSVGWHSDDEAVWGPAPTIASVSLGAPRRFSLRHKTSLERVDLELDHGSVLVMAGETQERWMHAVPKAAERIGARVNLTFRRLAG